MSISGRNVQRCVAVFVFTVNLSTFRRKQTEDLAELYIQKQTVVISIRHKVYRELTIFNYCLRTTKPPVDGRHVERSLTIFTLESKKTC